MPILGMAATAPPSSSIEYPAQSLTIGTDTSLAPGGVDPSRATVMDKGGNLIRLSDATTGGGGNGGGAVPSGYTRIKASDGTLHDNPSGNLPKARQIDPNLQVVQ